MTSISGFHHERGYTAGETTFMLRLALGSWLLARLAGHVDRYEDWQDQRGRLYLTAVRTHPGARTPPYLCLQRNHAVYRGGAVLLS